MIHDGISGPLDTLLLADGGVIRGTILHAMPTDGVMIVSPFLASQHFVPWEKIATIQLAGSAPIPGGAARVSSSPPDDHDHDHDYDHDYDYDYDREDETDIVCVRIQGRVIAMFDRANMKWDTALMALVRDGHICLSAEQKKMVENKTMLRGHPAWFVMTRAKRSELEEWTRAGQPILKAARAKAGQGKTSTRMAERIRYLATRLGLKDISIPEVGVEASRLERALSSEYNNRKEDGRLAATDRQIKFAKEMADRCNIEVPSSALASFKACSEFITRCQEIAPPTERELHFARMVACNAPIPDEVFKSAKACNEWIDRMESVYLATMRNGTPNGE